MTGMKSGTGDDLWGDDADEQDGELSRRDDGSESFDMSDDAPGTVAQRDIGRLVAPEPDTDGRPYIVARTLGDHSTQWRRGNRLTFFVRDHVAAGERELAATVEKALGRDVPVFDVREAAYLVAQQHEDAVIAQLREMGYERSGD